MLRPSVLPLCDDLGSHMPLLRLLSFHPRSPSSNLDAGYFFISQILGPLYPLIGQELRLRQEKPWDYRTFLVSCKHLQAVALLL